MVGQFSQQSHAKTQPRIGLRKYETHVLVIVFVVGSVYSLADVHKRTKSKKVAYGSACKNAHTNYEFVCLSPPPSPPTPPLLIDWSLFVRKFTKRTHCAFARYILQCVQFSCAHRNCTPQAHGFLSQRWQRQQSRSGLRRRRIYIEHA